jgi:hypothetical protein
MVMKIITTKNDNVHVNKNDNSKNKHSKTIIKNVNKNDNI